MICLGAGALVASLVTSTFTLAWVHSIEKTRWEEDWRSESEKLIIVEARIRSSGAGMEIPPDAVLKSGVWHYRPNLPAQSVLRLSHTSYTQGYEICHAGHCQPLAELLPGIDNTALIELRECSS